MVFRFAIHFAYPLRRASHRLVDGIGQPPTFFENVFRSPQCSYRSRIARPMPF
jgi:hypothetical protein